MSNITEELLRLLAGHEEGLADDQIQEHFGSRYHELAPAINELLSLNRLQLFTTGAGQLVYRAVKEETAAKFEGLGPEQVLVYQAIERAGNKGIWTRDIKNATNIPQHMLTKTLKVLEQRLLIKTVRSVVSKSKKLYMVYDMMPAKEITGGPWYSDQEFDNDFVTTLGNFIVQVVKNLGMADLGTISDKVRISGISKVELSMEELELIVNTLVYDNRLEEVQSAVLVLTGQSTAKKKYKASKPLRNAMDYLTSVPCGVCPVVLQCREGSVISPSTCQYYTQWLNACDIYAEEAMNYENSKDSFLSW